MNFTKSTGEWKQNWIRVHDIIFVADTRCVSTIDYEYKKNKKKKTVARYDDNIILRRDDIFLSEDTKKIGSSKTL